MARRLPKYLRNDHRRQYHQCSRKKGYETTKAANDMIKHQLRYHGVKLKYYRCDYCGKYHLTRKYVKNKF